MRDQTLETASATVPVRESVGEDGSQGAHPAELHTEGATSAGLAARAAVGSLALATAACGGGDGGSGSSGGGGAPPTGGGGTPAPTVLKPQTDAQAARFILQASIAASDGAIAEVKDLGYEPWLDAQMNLGNDRSARAFFADRGYDAVDGNRHYFSRRPADNMMWSQLIRGTSGVRKRAALALSEFFVVSLNSVSITWRSQALGEYWDILNEHAFGNYRDLLEAITLNPAMGVFLNTLGNRKADGKGRVPDENYGREVMQLFSIGLYELNIDGSLRTDSAGDPVDTYDNDDVTGIAKAFTGYDYDYSGVGFTTNAGDGGRQVQDPDYARQPMTADLAKWRRPRGEGFHSDEEKSFLGTTIAPGTGAAETLRLTLDALYNHPNVGPFLGRQMIQRLVTSNPSPAYVQRVAETFNNNGSGVRGDLRAMFKAVLLDDEALSDSGVSSNTFGKLREPMLRFAQFGRTFGARSSSGNWDVGDLSSSSNRLGQSPLRSPSVFNFFRPGYVPLNSQAADNGLVAPEFQIVNESTVATYVNFMERSIEGRGSWMNDIEIPYASELGIAHDSTALLDRLDLLLTARQLSQSTRSTILAALDDNPVAASDPEEDKLRRIHIAVLLVMASNDYMVQK
ncbi:DUF1800 domain-containing protein [Erythrobacter litoralis]|uniref:DUF1800 domain-containing protein n=1 Tax=Erythrobacter litoralis (strain HTCC2594) TaxID=314225 RepID=Q2NCV1_ERYLH|nr:DUF1800 domain-containing protein [Erythrobacter litoralis]ABC62490.1 hypothetical protein ELI_01990 [Erythrobacter litoralis HTCC2594]